MTTYYTNLNDIFPDIFQNLEILSEECAEVIQVKSKISRFGLFNNNPKTGVINRTVLVQELGDVLAMIDILVSNGVINDSELEKSKKEKIKKLNKYYNRGKNVTN